MLLYTKRLIIREHKEEDLESHHQLLSNSKSMYYLQDIQTYNLEQSRDNLMMAINDVNNPNRTLYFFRIEDKESLAFIGEIGYTVTAFTPVGKLVHLGYFIKSEFWGLGYTSEALKEIIRFSFEDNNVFRITTGCFKENTASEKVMIKCGMIKEAELKMKEWHDGVMKDRVEYRLLRHEWRKL